MPSPNSQVSELVALITNATKTIETLVERSSNTFPPSLNDTSPHPLDTEAPSIEMTRAVQILEGASAQLCATIARPNHTIVNKFMSFYEPACLRVALAFKIPDILQEKPEGMHISELGLRTGAETGKISRVLRLLATNHCFREVATDVFANNRISIQLLSTNPLSSLALHFTDEESGAALLLAETLADKEWGHSYAPEHSSFNKWSGYSKPLFVYFEGETPEGRMRGERFGVGMRAWTATTGGNAVVQNFPWGELSDGASICDLGGGIGTISLQLAKAYPTLKLKLQDLPERLQQAKTSVWPVECPEAISENRIEFKAIDFLAESPIKGCDVYYLKNIIHDWPDAECLKILSHIRDAMGPNSRVLIHEYIIQHANRVPDEESEFPQAPEPLLPNYGAGKLRHYYADVCLMTVLNSKERRLEEFIKLGSGAGLKFEKLWDLGEMGVHCRHSKFFPRGKC